MLQGPKEIQDVLLLGCRKSIEDADHRIRFGTGARMGVDRLQ